MTNHSEKMENMLPHIKLQQSGAAFMTLVSELIQKVSVKICFEKIWKWMWY